jgi:hypothetical protein
MGLPEADYKLNRNVNIGSCLFHGALMVYLTAVMASDPKPNESPETARQPSPATNEAPFPASNPFRNITRLRQVNGSFEPKR